LREFGFRQSHAKSIGVFVVQRGVEHGGIVGGENDRNAMALELGEGMVTDRSIFAFELERQGSGADVACRAELQRDLAFGEQIHQSGVVDGGDAMADALDTEELDGFADFFGTPDLAGVDQAMKA
jgi:hypothetical protein